MNVYVVNKKAYQEQLEFIKTFCQEFHDTLYFYGLNINGYICNFNGCMNSNKLLHKFIADGKLTNWVNDELENKRVQSVDKIDIFYFMHSYDINTFVQSKGGKVENEFFTPEELMKLDFVKGGYCHTNYTPVDFHESHDDNDDGESIFTYDESRKFM